MIISKLHIDADFHRFFLLKEIKKEIDHRLNEFTQIFQIESLLCYHE